MDKVTSINRYKERISNRISADRHTIRADLLRDCVSELTTQVVNYGFDMDISSLVTQIGIYNSEIVELKMSAARLRRM